MSYSIAHSLDNDEFLEGVFCLYSSFRLAFIDRPNLRMYTSYSFGVDRVIITGYERVGARLLGFSFAYSAHMLARMRTDIRFFEQEGLRRRYDYQKRLTGEYLKLGDEPVEPEPEMMIFGLTMEDIYQLKNFAQLHDYHPNKDGEARYYYSRY